MKWKGRPMTSSRRIVEIWFSFITESRADGLTWTEIERQLALKGCPISRGYLKVLYEKEETRISSPEQSLIIRWLYHNYEEISELAEKRTPWDLIVALVPPDEQMETSSLHLSDLIANFRRVQEAMASVSENTTEEPKPTSELSASASQAVKRRSAGSDSENNPQVVGRHTQVISEWDLPPTDQ